MSIKSDMMWRAGLIDNSIKLDEMAYSHMDKKFRILIANAKKTTGEKREGFLKQAVEAYIDKMAFYKNKPLYYKDHEKAFLLAAKSAGKGWSATSKNEKVRNEKFLGDEDLIKDFEDILMSIVRNAEMEIKKVPKVKKKQKKGTGIRLVLNPKTGKKEKEIVTTTSSVEKQKRSTESLAKNVQKKESERLLLINVLRKPKNSNDIKDKIKRILSYLENSFKERKREIPFSSEEIKKLKEIVSKEELSKDESVEAFDLIVKGISREVLKFWKGETGPSGDNEEILKDFIKGIGSVHEARIALNNSLKKAKGLRTLHDIMVKRGKLMKKESMDIKGKILAESLGYEGSYFWENYIFTKLTRTFAEEVSEYGVEGMAEAYADIYGVDTYPIWEYMANNEDMLYEAYDIEGDFLFENIGETNVKTYLTEIGTGGLGGAGAATGKLSWLQKLMTPVKNLGGATPIKATVAGAGPGIFGFLRGIWNKIKIFGGGILQRLKGFGSAVGKFFEPLLKGPIKWITTNPIAKIALPVVVLAGGVIGGIALINKLRKKAKMKKMSKGETAKLREVLAKKDRQLEALKRKGVKGIDKIKSEVF